MMRFSTIEEALEDLRQERSFWRQMTPTVKMRGRLYLCRRICHHGKYQFHGDPRKGLICMPMSEKVSLKAEIPQMVPHNTDNHETAFYSVD